MLLFLLLLGLGLYLRARSEYYSRLAFLYIMFVVMKYALNAQRMPDIAVFAVYALMFVIVARLLLPVTPRRRTIRQTEVVVGEVPTDRAPSDGTSV